MNVVLRLFCLLACLGIAAVATAAEKPFLPLGIWYEGGVGAVRDNVLPADPKAAAAVYEKNFADIAAHGINVITIPNSPPDHHKLILDTAHNRGLKIILELGLDGGVFGHMIRGQQPMDEKALEEALGKVLAPIQDHPALLRVQLLDEPAGDAFERYGHIARIVDKRFARTPAFCCLTGNSDGGAFLAASAATVVAFDDYPIGVNVKAGDDKPLRAFAGTAGRFVTWADKHDAQSWAVIQCHAITGALRFPTEAELRCMTWTSLATGNKGIFWFLYQSEAVGQAMMDGLVDRDFKSRPLWDEVARLTGEIAAIAPALADLHDPHEIPLDDKMLFARKLIDLKGKPFAIVVNFDTLKPRKVDLGGGAAAFELPPGGGKLIDLPRGR